MKAYFVPTVMQYCGPPHPPLRGADPQGTQEGVSQCTSLKPLPYRTRFWIHWDSLFSYIRYFYPAPPKRQTKIYSMNKSVNATKNETLWAFCATAPHC